MTDDQIEKLLQAANLVRLVAEDFNGQPFGLMLHRLANEIVLFVRHWGTP